VLPALRRLSDPASGLALGAVYRTALVSADVGTTPLGFPVANWVGGVRLTPTFGRIDAALGAFRRAVTSSQLSYAGRRDPVTGAIWGGVVETGLSASAGRYERDWSLAGSVRASVLDGRHVRDNRFVGTRVSADRTVWRAGAIAASVGVALTYWDYREQLLGDTWGQGGYWSPQGYGSLAVPLELEGLRGGYAFRLRLAPAFSTHRDRASAFYPLDPALMAAASLEPLPAGYARPYYEGGRSHGWSGSFYGAVEHAAGARAVVGAALDLDRSDYYHPTSLWLYVRRGVGMPEPVRVPPRLTARESAF
jgi:hypothetical protein